MLEIEGLQCRYGKVLALKELCLRVHEGELVTLIGANGAGKTTTLKAISGLVKPAAGRILFDGKPIHGLDTPEDIQRNSEVIRAYLGRGARHA